MWGQHVPSSLLISFHAWPWFMARCCCVKLWGSTHWQDWPSSYSASFSLAEKPPGNLWMSTKFKLHIRKSKQKKGSTHERKRHFEVRTTSSSLNAGRVPRKRLGNARSLWGLVGQGHHRSPCLIGTGAGRYPGRIC